MSWLSLPNEVSLLIFSHLDVLDLTRVSRTCKDWSKVATDPALWHPLAEKYRHSIGEKNDTTKKERNWFSEVKKYYSLFLSASKENIIRRACEGKHLDETSFARLERILEKENQETLKKSQVNVSSFSVVFSTPPPVVSYEEVYKFASVSITLHNTSEKKVNFEADILPNPKSHIEVHPSIAELGKEPLTVSFLVCTFCQMKSTQLVKIKLYKRVINRFPRRNNSVLKRVDLGTYHILIQFESEPSKFIDHDDIAVGRLIESSSNRDLYEGKYKNEEVYVEYIKNQPSYKEVRAFVTKILSSPNVIGITPVKGQPFCKVTSAT